MEQAPTSRRRACRCRAWRRVICTRLRAGWLGWRAWMRCRWTSSHRWGCDTQSGRAPQPARRAAGRPGPSPSPGALQWHPQPAAAQRGSSAAPRDGLLCLWVAARPLRAHRPPACDAPLPQVLLAADRLMMDGLLVEALAVLRHAVPRDAAGAAALLALAGAPPPGCLCEHPSTGPAAVHGRRRQRSTCQVPPPCLRKRTARPQWHTPTPPPAGELPGRPELQAVTDRAEAMLLAGTCAANAGERMALALAAGCQKLQVRRGQCAPAGGQCALAAGGRVLGAAAGIVVPSHHTQRQPIIVPSPPCHTRTP